MPGTPATELTVCALCMDCVSQEAEGELGGGGVLQVSCFCNFRNLNIDHPPLSRPCGAGKIYLEADDEASFKLGSHTQGERARSVLYESIELLHPTSLPHL